MKADHLVGYLVRINHDEENNCPVDKSPFFIGRDGSCQLRLKTPDVSERHCMLKILQRETVRPYSCLILRYSPIVI